jgi:pimeloyl-ACP methyl ester carboxylesterase
VTDVVFVIHGIRDQGYWTQKIGRTIKRQAAERHQDFRSVTASYGYFAMAPFLLPWVRRRKVAWLMDRYTEACARYPKATFSYVGHSNGTYLVARALRDYPAAKFRRIALAGSVVRSGYDWLGLINAGPIRSRVERVLNYVATNDRVVAIFPNGLEPIRAFDLGGAGHNGFTQGNDKGPVHQVEFIKGSHGAGHQEEHWNEIAAFIVDGTIPVRNALEQDQFCRRLGKASTSIVFGLFVVLLGLSLFSVALIFTSPAGVLFAALFLWAAYFVLGRL